MPISWLLQHSNFTISMKGKHVHLVTPTWFLRIQAHTNSLSQTSVLLPNLQRKTKHIQHFAQVPDENSSNLTAAAGNQPEP